MLFQKLSGNRELSSSQLAMQTDTDRLLVYIIAASWCI